MISVHVILVFQIILFLKIIIFLNITCSLINNLSINSTESHENDEAWHPGRNSVCDPQVDLVNILVHQWCQE